jgi:hypothetical protein
MNSINGFVNAAKGQPQMGLFYNTLQLLFMPISFYIAVKYGLYAIAVPWLTVYVLLCIGWVGVTLRTLKISFSRYLRNLAIPFLGTICMAIVVFSLETINPDFGLNTKLHDILKLAVLTFAGILAYSGIIWLFDRKFVANIATLFRKK